ncbi:O-antigen ligase family protein [Candidatus Nitrospira neomarina]|uniref:Uncharacterized protein n=1 Tax=Candidatus Nitrospira neomarina TaxID=3020899 RepID=A0AA96K549_9BACT|nr:hypothetical protein [Candidatus Nitrospira neomarina]WNM64079.1 hypothetical protein PQG83_10085 [Candidatus Nitrospira neomarina]
MAHPFFFHYEKFTNLFMVALVGLGIFRAQPFAFRPTQRLPWVQIITICLFLYAAISLSWSPAFEKGMEQWNYSWPYMVLNVLLLPLLFRHPTDLQDGLSAILYLGAVLATLVDLFVDWDNRFIGTFWDPSETIWDPLAFPEMAGLVTLAAILLNHEKSWKWTGIKLIAIVASIILVMKSETRGQFILMVTIPLVFLPFSRPVSNLKQYVVWALLGIGLASLSLYALNSFTAIEDRWSSSTFQSDWEGRVQMASQLLHHWWRASSGDPAALILGLGNSASFAGNIVGFYPHMVPIEVLGEEGIFGLGIFLGLLWVSIRTIRNAYSLVKHDPIQRGIWATLVASFVFAFLLSFKQGSLVGSGTHIFLFVILLERQVAILTAEQQEYVVG